MHCLVVVFFIRTFSELFSRPRQIYSTRKLLSNFFDFEQPFWFWATFYTLSNSKKMCIFWVIFVYFGIFDHFQSIKLKLNITIGTVLATERVFSPLSTLCLLSRTLPWKTTLKPQSCSDTMIVMIREGLVSLVRSCSSIHWHRITANGSLHASITDGTITYTIKQC